MGPNPTQAGTRRQCSVPRPLPFEQPCVSEGSTDWRATRRWPGRVRAATPLGSDGRSARRGEAPTRRGRGGREATRGRGGASRDACALGCGLETVKSFCGRCSDLSLLFGRAGSEPGRRRRAGRSRAGRIVQSGRTTFFPVPAALQGLPSGRTATLFLVLSSTSAIMNP